MALKAQITEDMKSAMRAKDSERLSAVRLLLAAIKQREVDERIELPDSQILAIIDKMIKQRNTLLSNLNWAIARTWWRKSSLRLECLEHICQLPCPRTKSRQLYTKP